MSRARVINPTEDHHYSCFRTEQNTKISRENRKAKLKYVFFLWLHRGLKETVLFWYCTPSAKGTASQLGWTCDVGSSLVPLKNLRNTGSTWFHWRTSEILLLPVTSVMSPVKTNNTIWELSFYLQQMPKTLTFPVGISHQQLILSLATGAWYVGS